MEEAGLVRRERPDADRRVIEVVLTEPGAAALQSARVIHRRGIHEHFAQHLDERSVAALSRELDKVSAHVRPLRPARLGA
jgi:DNA-binding MarR family transcriptional regulator